MRRFGQLQAAWRYNLLCKPTVLLPTCQSKSALRDFSYLTVTKSSPMTRPVMITVAPNGARKLKKHHPALPISPVELGATAASSFDAGASMLHLHVRDKNQKHSLDPDLYCLATQEIKRQAGSELIVQITTESVGKYRPEEQIECVKRTKPEAVS